MSVQALGWVLQHSEAALGERLVLLAIANYAEADGSDSTVGLGTIAKEARLSRRQVIRAIQSLEADKLLRVRRGEGWAGPGGKTNAYDILGVGSDDLSPPQNGGGDMVVTPTSPDPFGSAGSSDATHPSNRGASNGNGHKPTNGPLFLALVEACGYNGQKLKRVRSNIGKHATDLLELGASSGDVEWLGTFIRVRRHRAPTPQLIASMYPQIEELRDELEAYEDRLRQADDISRKRRR